MTLRNSPENYGTIAKTLHWLTALLFLFSYAAVYFRHWFTEPKTPENLIAIQLHLSIGITIAVVVLLRILWRLTNRPPSFEPGKAIEHHAAKIGHYLLYAVMIIMPITGYLGTGLATDYFFMFEIPKFDDLAIGQMLFNDQTGWTFKAFEKPIDFIHKDILGAWLVWILIVGHAGAALYHHYVRKDRTLLKMTSGR